MTEHAEPSDVFRRALINRRKALGLDQQQVVDRLRDVAGIPMDRTAYLRLERGARKITLDEACGLSVALSAPVSVLLSPVDGESVAVAPGLAVSPWRAWEWYRAEEPLDEVPAREWRPAVVARWTYADVRQIQKELFEAESLYRMATRDDSADVGALRERYLTHLREFAGGLQVLRGAGHSYRDLVPTDGPIPADLAEFTDWKDDAR